MVVRYLRDVSAVLHLRSLATGTLLQAVRLPGLGSVEVSGGRASPVFFYSYTSLTEPGAIFRRGPGRLRISAPSYIYTSKLNTWYYHCI